MRWITMRSVLGAAAVLAVAAAAVPMAAAVQENVQDDPRNPPQAMPDLWQQLAPEAQRMEMRTFLGVATRPIDAEARKMAELPEGVGLVVEEVVQESPAAAAGMMTGDVLHKLNDQLLVNLPQLSTLVRMHQPGETVELTIIRGGKPRTLSAELEERELPVARTRMGPLGPAMQFRLLPGGAWQLHEGDGPPLEILPFWEDREGLFMADPDAMQQQMRTLAEQARQAARAAENSARAFQRQMHEQQQNGGNPAGEADMNRLFNELRNELDQQRLELEALRPQLLMPGGMVEGANIVISDNRGSARLTMQDGQTQVRIEDQAGEVLYEGDWPSEAERADLPEVVRMRFEQLRKYAPQIERSESPRQQPEDAAEPEDREPEQPRQRSRPSRSGAVRV